MRDFKYKKSLGQNFLNDNNIINKIVNSLDINENDLIIEIGPGAGALTKELCLRSNNVYSFEIDKRLENTLSHINNSHIIYEDFLRVNLKDFIKDKKYNNVKIIGNLPYYITTPIINKITDEIDAEKIIIMIQKEVANRFMAKSSTKEYGSISVYLQYNYNIKKICDVNRRCFYPIPNVDSMVIELSKRDKEVLNNIEEFNKLIKDSFKLKRKNLRNNLINYDLVKIEKLLKDLNKDLSFRAEELTVSDYVYISNELNK